MDITLNNCVSAPANDLPCNATNLSVGTSPSYTSGTTIGATTESSMLDPECAFFVGNDVWYTATVPANGLLIIDTQSGTMLDGGIAIYTATSCSGTYEMLDCNDDDSNNSALMPSLYVSYLDPGTVVYVRVWSWGGLDNGTFNITAYSPTGDCVYVLDMEDSWGDGWDGSTVDVSINGGGPTSYTVTAGRNMVYLSMSISDLIVLSYTSGGGGYENEISYKLVLKQGILFADGPNPTTGVVYSGIVDCVSPPAPVEDCVGGTTICSNGSFSGNTSHTGLRTDLNASNEGCLTATERQGTWYHFSPSAGGTIEMTISPTDPSDDYDFAIWGPLTSLDCPPSGNPLRCSYASPGGDTGMQSGSGDTSENAGGDKWVDEMDVLTGEVYIMYIDNWSTTNQSFDLTWDLTNGASLDCTVLPIELTTFRAEQDNSLVRLNWVTESEINNDHFNIQRSSDGDHFGTIATVSGMGTTQSPTFYEHVDHEPLLGINYYRLQQVDHDGTSSFSDVVSVTFNSNGVSVSAPYPNPTTDGVSINVYSSVPGAMTSSLIDATGRVLETQELALSGNQQLDFDLSTYPKGLYMISLRDATGSVNEDHIVIKE